MQRTWQKRKHREEPQQREQTQEAQQETGDREHRHAAFYAREKHGGEACISVDLCCMSEDAFLSWFEHSEHYYARWDMRGMQPVCEVCRARGERFIKATGKR
jgi:hypothetical protein